jgi:hypothetical protein
MAYVLGLQVLPQLNAQRERAICNNCGSNISSIIETQLR